MSDTIAEIPLADDIALQRSNQFSEFLEYDGHANEKGAYKDQIPAMLENKQRRLMVSIDALRQWNRELAME
ncbi:hypothetical protein CU098_011084 [Rhizopus stolonifer]|uniref:MCM N-terminal domain-containing protein n=2 Tax=Mucorineae TaxID=1344963 RepID=A0A367KKP4_RHIST|nr:hypothetical protein CU098_011084 [Rhizopus stolonifer]